MNKINIADGGGKGTSANVTSRNQLVVGPLDFSQPVEVDMDTIDTAFNFIKPKAGQIIIITDIIINAQKTISVNGAIVEIYEADAVDSTTVDKQIIKVDIARQGIVPLTGLNFRITEGAFINGKTDSATVLATIAGYFAPA